MEEYDAIGNNRVAIRMDGEDYEGTHWCDIIQPVSAETLAVYDDYFYAGKTAVTRNAFGKGIVYYIGTVGLPALCCKLAECMLIQEEIPYFADLPERVEVTVREGEGKRFTFVFNNDEVAKDFVFK